MTWDEWGQWYATTFAVRGEAAADMLANWVDLFAGAGWTPDEMHAAARSRFGDLAGAYPSEQLQALIEAVRSARAGGHEAARRRLEQEDSRGVCCDCQGSGMMAGMPLPGAEPGPTWRTCAVLCHCPLGRWLGQRQGSKPLMGLSEYAARVPDWRDRQAAYHRYHAALAKARSASGHLDRAVREIVRKAKGATGD